MPRGASSAPERGRRRATTRTPRRARRPSRRDGRWRRPGWVSVAAMTFTGQAEHYDRFMGRYTRTLGPALADAAGIASGMTVVDVGCGPGGLTSELARRVGVASVAAI